MITNKDRSWYSLALKIASESTCKSLHGCVIVKSGSVISLATNRFVNGHPVSQKYLKRDLHAEQRALIKATNVKGATLYSARLHPNPISIPCELCSFLIMESGISRVVAHDGQSLVKFSVM
jgi:deoxycytidylate deaminase